jgi:hypothetical protein
MSGASTTHGGSRLDVLAFNRQGEGFGVVLDGNSTILMPDGLRQTVEIGLQALRLAREIQMIATLPITDYLAPTNAKHIKKTKSLYNTVILGILIAFSSFIRFYPCHP